MTDRRSFGPERRLRRRSDYVRIQSEGRRVTSAHFVFLVCLNPKDRVAPARLGLVVTRKVGGAVARNRIKRVCRECFRTWPALLPAGVDLVIVARQGADSLGLSGTRAEWREASSGLRRRASEALAQPAREPHVSGHPPLRAKKARSRRGAST